MAKKSWAYLLLLLVCVSWANVAFASPITPQMRQQDTRLEKPVTVIAHRLYVGELLEYLSQQSGVTLSASEKDGTANERLSVAFQNLPLADALNAVQSLYSYQGSSYRWSRDQDSDPKKPSFSYRLVRSPDARAFAETVTNEIQQDFAKEIHARIAALGMSPEERRKAAVADPGLDMSKRGEAAMGALASILSPEQLAHTIESDEEIRIPANQFGAEGNSFINSEKDIFTHDNPTLSWPQPVALIFQRSFPSSALAPCLLISMESSQQYNGISVQVRQGYGWAGGGPLEDRWKKKLDNDWRQNSNEQPTASYASDTLKSAAKEKTEDAYSDIQFQRLRTLSQIAPISIVARLPYNGDDPGSPVGKTLPVFLRNLERMRLNYKWSGSVLVVTYHTWIRIESEEEKNPWSVVKRLRESCANNSGHVLSINDLCDAASVLTPIQLQKMAQSEQWYFDCWPNMQDVLRFQPLLTALNRNPSLLAEALSEKGVATSVLPAAARSLLENPPIRGGRLYIQYIPLDAETKSLQFSVSDKLGAIVNSFGIFLKPWVPDPAKRLSVMQH